MPFWSALPTLASAGASLYGANRSGREAKRAGRYQNPAESAMNYFRSNPQVAGEIFSPYTERGKMTERHLPDIYNQMYGEYANAPDIFNDIPDLYAGQSTLNTQNERMAGNPSSYINEIQRGYTPSEGYRYKERRMRDAARAAASSGGFAGTEFDQERQADMIRGLLGDDMQQFLQNVMGAQQYGLGGQERALAGRERANERSLLGRERALVRGLEGRERALGARAQSGEYAAQRGFNASQALANALMGNNNLMGETAYYGRGHANEMGAEARQAQGQMIGKSLEALQNPAFQQYLRSLGGNAPRAVNPNIGRQGSNLF